MPVLSWVNEVSPAWLAAMGQVSVRVAIVLGVTWLISLGLRSYSAALRHAIWAFSLAAVATTPLLLDMAPQMEIAAWAELGPDIHFSAAESDGPASYVDAPLAVTAGGSTAGKLASSKEETAESEPLALPPAANSASLATGSSVPGASLLVAVWMLGFSCCGLRLLVGHLRLRRMARQAARQPDYEGLTTDLGIARPVQYLRSSVDVMPMTWGWREPKILVPASFEQWGPARCSMTILHELAHVRRHDWLTQTFAQMVSALLWFHPMVWIAARRIQVEADRACDDIVLREGSKASGYAEHLVQAARQFSTNGLRPWVAIAMARPSSLDQRVRYVLDRHVNRSGLGVRRGIVAAVGVMAIALLTPSVDAVSESAASTIRQEAPKSVRATASVLATNPAEPTASVPAERTDLVSADTEVARPFSERAESEPTILAQAQPAPRPQPELEHSDQIERARERVEQNRERIEEQRHRRAEHIARRTQPTLSPEALQVASAALRKALNSPDVEVRAEAAESLGRIGSAEEANLEALGAALSDAEPRVQKEAVESLSRLLARNKEIPPEQAVRWLTPALGVSDANMRKEAVEALGRLRGLAAIQAAAKAMDDTDPSVQREAVESLGRLLRSADVEAAKAAMPNLEKALQHEDPMIRKEVVEALGGLRSIANEVVPLLAKAAEDPDPGVQKEAVEALGKISSRSAFGVGASAGFGAAMGRGFGEGLAGTLADGVVGQVMGQIERQMEEVTEQLEDLDLENHGSYQPLPAAGDGVAGYGTYFNVEPETEAGKSADTVEK